MPDSIQISELASERLVSLAGKICRFLPASVAYRFQFRFLTDLIGRKIPFQARSRIGGYCINGDLRDNHDAVFALHGFTNFVGVVVAKLLKPARIFELGANVGTDTLSFAGITKSGGQVVAVEASKENFLLLQKRLEANAISHVTPKLAGVSDSGEHLRVFFNADDPGQTFTSSGVSGVASEYMVEGVTVDNLTDAYGAPSLIVADLEGYEEKAFRGASSTLAKHRPIIVTEVDNLYLERSGDCLEGFFEVFTEQSYRLFDLHTRSLTELNIPAVAHKSFVHTDCLGIPAERAELLPFLRKGLWRARYLPSVFNLNPLGHD